MDHVARIIADITGCTPAQSEAVIAALLESGWSPPKDQAPRISEAAAQQLLDELPADTVLTAHTDGACSGNPGPGGWSVVFSVVGAIVGEFSGSADYTTSNRMELNAVREAIAVRQPPGVATNPASRVPSRAGPPPVSLARRRLPPRCRTLRTLDCSRRECEWQ